MGFGVATDLSREHPNRSTDNFGGALAHPRGYSFGRSTVRCHRGCLKLYWSRAFATTRWLKGKTQGGQSGHWLCLAFPFRSWPSSFGTNMTSRLGRRLAVAANGTVPQSIVHDWRCVGAHLLLDPQFLFSCLRLPGTSWAWSDAARRCRHSFGGACRLLHGRLDNRRTSGNREAEKCARGWRYVAAIGSGAAAASALFGMPMQAEALIPGLLLLGLGRVLLVTPLFNTILADIPHSNIGSASGMLSTIQQVGGTFGIALVGILFATVLVHTRSIGVAEAEAYSSAFAAASGYAALMGLLVLALLFSLPRSHTAAAGGSRLVARPRKCRRPAPAPPQLATLSPSSARDADAQPM